MKYESQQYRSNNANFVTSSALQLRLDTSDLLNRILTFLTGETTIIKKIDGKLVTETIFSGVPKANKLGVQTIINTVNLILNPSFVQGNYTEEQYAREISQMRRSLRDAMMVNIHEWEISENDYENLIDSIMFMLKGFISRLINNKERESYEESLRHFETNTQTFDKRDKGGY